LKINKAVSYKYHHRDETEEKKKLSGEFSIALSSFER
jgi:hypothetical protein